VTEPDRDAGDPEILRRLLSSIERDSAITQRKLAGHLGIALGLTNAYLRRCVRKGLVKVTQVPLNRYGYYLTPQGFAEKSRLTADYLAASFNFFRQARNDCAVLLAQCAARGWRRVTLCGAGDLAEIMVLSAGDTGMTVVCIIDETKAGLRLAGLPIVADLAAARLAAGTEGIDGVIVTDTGAPRTRFAALLASAAASGFAAADIVAPDLLGISLAALSEAEYAPAQGADPEAVPGAVPVAAQGKAGP
jgi:DNA-binding MarR family transcriptional regulator